MQLLQAQGAHCNMCVLHVPRRPSLPPGFWNEIDVFREQLRRTEGKPEYR